MCRHSVRFVQSFLMDENLANCIIPIRPDERVFKVIPNVSAFPETQVIIVFNDSSPSFHDNVVRRFPWCRFVTVSLANRSLARHTRGSCAHGNCLVHWVRYDNRSKSTPALAAATGLRAIPSVLRPCPL